MALRRRKKASPEVCKDPVYTREELLALAEEAADGARVEVLDGGLSAAFNLVAIHGPPIASG